MSARIAHPDTFAAVFGELRGILEPYGRGLRVTADTPDGYSIDTTVIGPNGKPVFFAAVQKRKGYVSFYLMPVYLYPDLLRGVSDGLKRRMQGKSCFNFKSIDPQMVKELSALTAAGVARFRKEGIPQRPATN